MTTATEPVKQRHEPHRTDRKQIILSLTVTYAFAGALALAIASIFILAFGGNLFVAFGTVLRASLGSWGSFAQTLNKFCPLLLGSLSVAFGMRGGFFNIGVDGQIYAGAIGMTAVAFAFQDTGLSAWLYVPLGLLGGILAGGFWGLIPGFLRVRYGVSEIFVTVMLNFVAFYLVDYLANGPWNDPLAGEAITLPIPESSVLPAMMPKAGAHAGALLALAGAVLIAFLMNRTIMGYEIRAVGDNPIAARFGGINIKRVTLITMPLCGALSGLAGAIEVSGFHQSLMLGITGPAGAPNYGAMAILIAVIGHRNPLGVVLAAAFFTILLVGSDSLQRSIGLPASAVFVFQAVIVLAILYVEARRALIKK
jgi:simple sugar transport system permease protein